jgi:hypothetical protein
MWLKEVALKRRARARQPTPERVADELFDEPLTIVEGSVGTKPHHMLVEIPEAEARRRYVCWGPGANAKHLFWASLNAIEEDPTVEESWVVIVDTLASPTPTDRRRKLTSLAARCGLRIDWMNV